MTDTEHTSGSNKKEEAYSLRIGNIISMELECFRVSDFYVFLENNITNLRQIFIQILENTCSLQPAVKSAALGF